MIRKVWSGERNSRFEGEHYHLRGAQTGPEPAHRVGIWLGVGGPRGLALAGGAADGWLPSSPWAPPERLPELHARIDEAAMEAGRKPSDIRRVYNVAGSIGPGRTAAQWAAELTDLVVGFGMDSFVFWAEDDDQERQVHLFAEEVVPEVRRQVAMERQG